MNNFIKHENGDAAIGIILFLVAFMLIIIAGKDMGLNLDVQIMHWLFGTSNMILFVPGTLSCSFGGVLVLLNWEA